MQDPTPDPGDTPPQRPASGEETCHILLLEDDPAHIDLMLRAFRQDPGAFRVSYAGTLHDARPVLTRDPPDLIIADWMLPDGRGIEILPVKAGHVATPLVILTSHGNEKLAVEMMKSGAMEYLVKSPAMFHDLPQIASRVLREWDNIRKREEAERSAGETEKRLADIIAFLPDAVLAIDDQGVVIAWNAAMENLTGVTAGEMIGKGEYAYSIPIYGEPRPILIDLVRCDHPAITAGYDRLRCDGGTLTAEIRFARHPAERWEYLWASARPLHNSEGRCVGAIEVIRDITEQKRGEEMLAARETTLKTLLNAPADTISLIDPKGIILDINEAGARRLGGSIRDLTGRCVWEILPPAISRERKVRIDGVFASGEPAIFDDERNGRTLHNEVYPVFGPDGTTVDHVAIFARDITDRVTAERALRESEQKYRFLVDNVRDIIWQATPDLVFTYLSPATLALTGYTPEELTGTRLLDLLTGDSAENVRKRLRERLQECGNGHPVSATVFEIEVRRKDGDRRWLEVSSNPVYDPGGTFSGFQGITRDITARKEDGVRLLLHSRILETLEEGVSMVRSSDGIIVYANPRFNRMFGYADGELEGKPIAIINAPADGNSPEEVAGAIMDQLERNGSFKGEVLNRKKDGSTCWCRGTIVPFVDARFGPVWISSQEDITKQKQAALALRESEEKFRALVETSPDIIWEIDCTGIFTYASPQCREILGYPQGELIGRPFSILLTPASAETVMAIFRSHVASRSSFSTEEVPALHRDGRSLTIEIRSVPVTGPDGTLTGFRGIARDVTGEKQARDIRRAYETRLDTAMEIGSLSWWEMDLPDGSVRFDSRKAGMLGYPPERFRHYTDFMELVHPDDYEPAMQGMRDHLAGKQDRYTATYRIRTAGGDYRWFRDVGGITKKNPDGTPATVTGIVIDITRSREADEKLRISEQLLRQTQRLTRVGGWEYDVASGERQWTDGVYEIYGMDPGRPLEIAASIDCYVPEDRRTIESAFANAVENGIPYDLTLRIVAKDGVAKWVRTSAQTERRADGKIVRVYGNIIDISDIRAAEAALRESEERFREIFNKANDGIELIGLNPDGNPGRFLEVNEIACRMVGYTRDELLASGPFAINTEVYDPPLAEILSTLKTAGHATLTTEHRRKDGTVFPVEINTHVISFRGRPALLSVIRDITERRQIEATLADNREYLDTIFTSVQSGIMVIDAATHTILDLNPAAAQMIGTTRDRIVNKTCHQFICPAGEGRCPITDLHQQLDNSERILMTADGGRLPIIKYVVPVTIHGKECLLETFIDNSERKKTETALRESEERYRMLVEEMPDFVIVHREGRLLYVNAAISRMLGRSAENLIGTSIMEYIAPESREAVLNAMDKRGSGGAVAPYTARLLLPDDSTRWVEIRGAGIMYGGKPASFNVLTDITEKKWAEEALYESEKKFRTVADFTYDWEYWTGKDRDLIYVSPSCERISGYSPADFYRNQDLIRQIVHPDDRQILAGHLDSLSAKPDTAMLEFRIVRKDGRITWIGHICQPIFSPDGEYLGRRGSNRDITEMKAAGDALRSSEVRFRSLIQNSSDIIRILDQDRRIVYESSSGERILGYPPGYFVGRDPGEYIHPDDRKRVRADYEELLANQSTGLPTEFRIRKADGEYLWVDAVGTNLLGIPGVDGIVVTIRPIQQRKMMEEQLRENQIRLATAMDMASLVNWEFDVNEGVFTFNDRFYALYGTTAEREGGYRMPAETYVREFVHPDDVADAARVIGNAASVTDPGYSAELEHRIIRRDGEMRYIIVRFGVIMDADGKVVRTRGANQDITSQKMMESEIRSLNRSLEQRVIQRTEELNRSLQEKELLLREIHHRVKNNLQIIISILRLQKRTVTDSGTLSAIMDSESRVRSMALVHEKLYRSKDLEHIDIGDYLRALTQYLFSTYAVEQRKIRFRVSIAGMSLDIQRAIPVGLIINELLTNALKHAFPGGRTGEIGITGKKEGDRILILIDDDGIGIPEGLDWRNSPSLGMHLVMTLIAQVRGTIVLNTGTPGTHFVIALPEQEGGAR